MNLDRSDTSLLVRLLSSASLRARTIAGNVSNQNTPGYVRRTVRFEDVLEQAAERGESLEAILPHITEDHSSPAGPDGNNVSLELELNSARENRLLYETYATILQNHFQLIQYSITGGR